MILDDLSTGVAAFGERLAFYRGDVGDGALVAQVFGENPDIEAVVHCAAKIVVPESMADPLAYYASNVGKALTFLRAVRVAGCRRILFSSTAALYAPGPDLMVDETSAIDPQSRTRPRRRCSSGSCTTSPQRPSAGTDLPVRTAPPRPGDVVGCATRADKAARLLGWRAELSVEDGIRDSLAWRQRLPHVLA